MRFHPIHQEVRWISNSNEFGFSDSEFRIPNFDFRFSNSEFRILISVLRIPNCYFRFLWIPILEFRISNSEFRIPNFVFRISSSEFRIPKRIRHDLKQRHLWDSTSRHLVSLVRRRPASVGTGTENINSKHGAKLPHPHHVLVSPNGQGASFPWSILRARVSLECIFGLVSWRYLSIAERLFNPIRLCCDDPSSLCYASFECSFVLMFEPHASNNAWDE